MPSRATSCLPCRWTGRYLCRLSAVTDGSKYEGDCYMERIKDIINVNRRYIANSDNLTKASLATGDVV